MSKPDPAQSQAWQGWLAERPRAVQEVARQLPPWTDYTIKATGQRCQIVSYGEHDDGSVTLTVNAWQEWLPALTAVQVFGLSPDDLQPTTPGVG